MTISSPGIPPAPPPSPVTPPRPKVPRPNLPETPPTTIPVTTFYHEKANMQVKHRKDTPHPKKVMRSASELADRDPPPSYKYKPVRNGPPGVEKKEMGVVEQRTKEEENREVTGQSSWEVIGEWRKENEWMFNFVVAAFFVAVVAIISKLAG